MRVSEFSGQWNALSGMKGSMADATPKTNGDAPADAADISAEGMGKADFSSPLWSAGDSADFTMNAYTSRGTSVTLEARQRSFGMGRFARADSLFQGGGQQRSGMDLNITFTSASGVSQSFKVADNMRFLEGEDGRIRVDEGGALPQVDAQGKPDNAIVVNLTDGARLQGGDGDDVLFNLGLGAVLDGGAGDDTLLSMGDGASLLGGDGNDTLKVVRDVIRKESMANGGDMKPTDANLKKAALEGFEKGQSVIMDGGDGDDSLESDVKLHDSTIRGGKGDDAFRFGTLVGSTLDAGAGNDTISVDKLSASIVRGGDGDDAVTVDTAANGSTIDGGKGDDGISARHVSGSSMVRGGDGNDVVRVDHLEGHSVIDGGDGDDTMDVLVAENSAVMGGAGNDAIYVGYGDNAVVSGGKGDDVITVASGKGNLISGDDGNDDISVGGASNIVDGGAGTDSIRAGGAVYVTDEGALVRNGMEYADLADTADGLRDTLEHSAIDADSRQRYQALLSYALQQAAGERTNAGRATSV